MRNGWVVGDSDMRILVVDDAYFVRTSLVRILQEDNHEIVGEAEDGVEALDKYKILKPDLVTMDITMPRMDGIECTKKILEYDPEAKIIICSSMGQQEFVFQAIRSGAKDFIVKPFEKERVKEAVRKYR